jgi:purine-binding chemotaxis protein CheW
MTASVSLAQAERQLVVFELSTESYGVDIGAVREIIRMQEITRVPRTPSFVEGVINLRGRVIPVIDLRKRFCLSVCERNRDSRIVVVDIAGQDIGVVVDAVTEVLRIKSDSIAPPSTMIAGADSTYLIGIVKLEGRLVILLDLARVLSDDEQSVLAEGGEARTQRAIRSGPKGTDGLIS